MIKNNIGDGLIDRLQLDLLRLEEWNATLHGARGSEVSYEDVIRSDGCLDGVKRAIAIVQFYKSREREEGGQQT